MSIDFPQAIQPIPWWWWPRWKIIWGIPNPFWLINEQWIERFIAENKLAPISKEAQSNLIMGPLATMPTVATKESKIVLPIWRYGGMKAAHLHFKDNVYVLQPDQWAKFTAPILDRLKSRLSAAKTVGFDKMMELSESVNEMM